jgi:hypothetical protein
MLALAAEQLDPSKTTLAPLQIRKRRLISTHLKPESLYELKFEF